VKLFKTTYKHHSDEQLMGLIIRQMDHSAFEQLYDRYARKLTAFCNRLVQSGPIAEDLVHEVFIKVIEQPQSFNVQLKFSTWIYTIAHHLCLNAIRNQQNRNNLLAQNYTPEESFIAHSTIDANQLKVSINSAYKLLSEKEKAVFVLRFEHELSIKEIADIIEIPEGSVKSCLFYLLKKFDTHLQPFKAIL
jgi:RNA polymerase sigma-70 factor, ECF subfamily